jgi:hypothetical protein
MRSTVSIFEPRDCAAAIEASAATSATKQGERKPTAKLRALVRSARVVRNWIRSEPSKRINPPSLQTNMMHSGRRFSKGESAGTRNSLATRRRIHGHNGLDSFADSIHRRATSAEAEL